MKFSSATLLAILPLLAAQASALAVPEGRNVGRSGRQGALGGQGGKGAGGKGKGGAAGAGAANATAAAANATATGAASAAANATAAAAGNATAAAGGAGGDAQTSLTLDPAVIAKGFESDGNQTPAAGQVASLTSSNNFINFCATTNQPITNGQQVKTGSCNPAPMGQIPATTAMPSCKFSNPKNGQDIAANTPFTITMNIQNLETGNFVNAQANYFAAPQQLNAQGQIKGHSHVVVESLNSLTQTTPNDPNNFAFFLGLNSPASGGALTADVTKGLPAGTYKVSSINTAANHQPCLVPVAQHGSLDDVVYFTVGGGGAGGAGGAFANATAGAGAAAGAANSTAAGAGAAASASASAAAGGAKGGKGGKGAASAASVSSAASAASSAAGGKGAVAGGKGAASAASVSSAAGAASSAAGGKGAAAGGKGAKGAGGKQGGKNARRFIREAY